MEDGLYTMIEAAEKAGILRQSIYRAVKEGRVQSVEKFGKKLIPEWALTQYIAEQGHKNGANTKKAKA